MKTKARRLIITSSIRRLMGDSDDEYDRKRRDKFRGERSDTYRTERRDERPRLTVNSVGGRDDWPDRNPFRGGVGPIIGNSGGGATGGSRPRPEYRDYRGPRERYASPGREMPPAKRMRHDWPEDMRGGGGPGGGSSRFGYDPYFFHAWNEHYAQSLHSAYAHVPPHPSGPRERENSMVDTQTQPAMMTLKQFLDTQDDGISDSEVLRKYTEYKNEFKRQQLNEFFVSHKDEEWFKHKYHPEESVKRKNEQRRFLLNRINVFTQLLHNGMIGNTKVDSINSDALIRLLDTVVIKLEGGTDEDLKILDYTVERKLEPERSKVEKPNDDDVIITSVETIEKEEAEPVVVSPQHMQRLVPADGEENWDDDDDDNDNTETAETPASPKEDAIAQDVRKNKKKLRKSSESSNSTSSNSSSDSSSSEDDEVILKQKYDLAVEDIPEKTVNAATFDIKMKQEKRNDIKKNGVLEDKSTVEDNADKEKKGDIKMEESTEADSNDNNSDEKKVNEAIKDNKSEVEKNSEINEESKEIKKDEETQPETIDLDKVKDGPQPRALHRTSSIFLRNLAPTITKAEIETICKRYSGFLRVAIADPAIERRWYRRGWITFQRDVNIKEICWTLNNQRLRDCEMGAIVNRDLSRRVRPANGITAHKNTVRADIKLCVKIVMNLDERFNLWNNKTNETNNENVADDEINAQNKSTNDEANTENTSDNIDNCYGFKTNNPVLQNITDFLIEEASAEEEELLGITGEAKDADGEAIERDEQLITVLDRLVLYLRIVHSVDYYNHCEYPYEDEMPNRCGIIHARGPPPTKTTNNDVQDYIKAFENKLSQFLIKASPLSDEEICNLGAKDSESEVEKFIQANSQELAKDKWLCPLSGKKFKGPEFIRKHIFNKHMEKVEEVKTEVEYFNNYLRDPKRPQLPEHPGTNKRTNSESNNAPGGYRPPMYPPFVPPYGFAPPMMMPGRGRGVGGFGGARRPGGFDYRPRSHYRDLDAPQELY